MLGEHLLKGPEKHGVRWGVEVYDGAGKQGRGLDFQTDAFNARF